MIRAERLEYFCMWEMSTACRMNNFDSSEINRVEPLVHRRQSDVLPFD